MNDNEDNGKTKSLFADVKSVYINYEIEIKSFGFFLLTTLSILCWSFILNLNMVNTILIIVFSNRLWFRSEGFHASCLKNCYIISLSLFLLFAWLSGVFTINPMITLISCIIIMHDRLEQASLLAVILTVSFLKVEYAYLSTVLFMSLILAYITSGQGIFGKLMIFIDKCLCKVTKYK